MEIEQTDQQFLFTYCDMYGNINKCVHTDLLNYRMKSVRKRHPELKLASPHKLCHTTLAKKIWSDCRRYLKWINPFKPRSNWYLFK